MLKRELINITVKPTSACNMRCNHCYYSDYGYDNVLLDISKFKYVLEIASKEYKKISLLIHGGEPTLAGYHYFRELFDHQKYLSDSAGCNFTNVIQTNGLLLNEEMADLFKQYSVGVGVSFDGPHNDYLRSNTSEVYRTLKLLQDKKVRFYSLCVETKETIANLIETYEWYKKEGLNYKILCFIDYNRNNSIYNVTPEEYVKNMINLYKYWIADKECNISVSTLEGFANVRLGDKLSQVSKTCVGNRISVNADGSIYPCGRPYDRTYEVTYVDELKMISDCFAKPGYIALLDLLEKRKSKCKKECKYFSICNGGCISNAILDGSNDNLWGDSCKKSYMLFEEILKINNEFVLQLNGNNYTSLNPRFLKTFKYRL